MSRERYPDNGDDNEYKDLYIGNIPYSYTEEKLKEFFEGFNPQIKILTDPRGKSKGTDFVTFETHEEALEFKNKFDGKEVEERPLKIKWDKGLDNKKQDPKRFVLFKFHSILLTKQ